MKAIFGFEICNLELFGFNFFPVKLFWKKEFLQDCF